MNKVVANADEAVRDIPNNAVLMLGGFGMVGFALRRRRTLATA